MGDDDGWYRVAVVYALPARQITVQLSVRPGSTAGEAVNQSGLLERFCVGTPPSLARFGKPLTWNSPVEHHDRIDILRPLVADPMEFRRRRAALQGRKLGRR